MTQGQGGKSEKIPARFWDLQVRGPPQGYLPDPTKIILVVAPRNVARAREFFQGMGFKVATRSCYLGSFSGDREAETTWLESKVQGSASTLSLIIQDCRSRSNRIGYS